MIVEADLISSDPAPMLIYADWLEEQQDHHGAAYLRTELGVRALSPRSEDAWEIVEVLASLAKTLDRTWLAHFTRPSVAGLVYAGINDKDPFTARFLPDGTLNYTQGNASYQNGTWWQVGSLIYWELNRFFVEYVGALIGDHLIGAAENISSMRWEFDLAATSDPTMIEIPGDTNRQIYGPETGRWQKSIAPVMAKPKRRRKKKKPFSSARRAGSAGARAGCRPA